MHTSSFSHKIFCCTSGRVVEKAAAPAHLEEQAAVRLQADALAVGQREQVVVVHDAVQVLHPHRVHVPVKHQKARLILRQPSCMPWSS